MDATGKNYRFHELSGGLWGIESDAGDYLNEVYEEEKAGLLTELRQLAFAIQDMNPEDV